MTRAQGRHLRRRERRGLHRATTCSTDDRRRRLRDALHAASARWATRRSSCSSRASTTCRTRCAPPRRPRAAGATLEHIVAGLATMRAGAGPIAVQNRAAVAPGSSTTPTTPTRARCTPASKCSRSSMARTLAGARRHGRARRVRRRQPRGDRRVSRASTASTGCSPPGTLAALAVESFGAGARMVRRHARRWRARSNAELTRDVRVLVKGSRFNRLERVVEALAGTQASTGLDRSALLARHNNSRLHYSGFNVFSYLTVRAILRGAHRARALAAGRAVDDRAAVAFSRSARWCATTARRRTLPRPARRPWAAC